MPIPRCVVWLFSIGMMLSSVNPAGAQTYPSRLIRIVTAEAGAGGDFAARVIAQGLATSLGQAVVVENRGGGVIAGEIVAKAPPDGHTLLLYGNTLWPMPLMRTNVSYDPIRDFAPITLVATSPTVLVVHPSVPANSVKELIALARAKPGGLNYSSAAAGTSSHLAAELFKSMAVVDVVRVPFKGMASALNALIGGEVQVMFPQAAGAAPHIQSGRIKGLAVTSSQPSALVPNLPTLAASGLPGFEAVAVNGVFAPAKCSPPIVERLHREIVAVLKRADVRERYLSNGSEVVGSSPQQLAEMMKSEIIKWGRVIKDAGIRDE